MNSFKRLILTAVLGIALAAAALPLAPQAFAAGTPNVTPAAGQVVVVPIFISGQRTATTAAVVKWKMPFPCDVLGVSAVSRANGANTPTLTVDVQMGGVTILAAPITITSGTVAEGTVTVAAITDEAVMTIDLAIGGGGGSPTWDDITVLITVVRK